MNSHTMTYTESDNTKPFLLLPGSFRTHRERTHTEGKLKLTVMVSNLVWTANSAHLKLFEIVSFCPPFFPEMKANYGRTCIQRPCFISSHPLFSKFRFALKQTLYLLPVLSWASIKRPRLPCRSPMFYFFVIFTCIKRST